MFEANKQDRQAARTVEDLERRHNLGGDSAEYVDMRVTRLVAGIVAAEAIRAVNSLMRMTIAGDKFVFDLGSDTSRRAEISDRGLIFESLGPSGVLESKLWYPSLEISPASLRHDTDDHINMISGYASDLVIGVTPAGDTGHLSGYNGVLIIGAPAFEPGNVVIEGKRVSWKDNGDGTYSLIGTDYEW